MLDVEWNGQSKTCPKKLPREEAIAQMKVILAAMEQAYGKRPVIYTSIDFHRDVMQGEFNDYPIWVRSVKCNPALKYGARKWRFWQHTAEGRVAGIKGNVDENAFYGTPPEWRNFLALASSPEPSSATPEARAITPRRQRRRLTRRLRQRPRLISGD